MRTPEQLEASGYTESGRTRYLKTATDYLDEVFNRSVKYGELDKDQGSNLEVTHEHVREAAHSIARSYGKERPTRWAIASQIGEYLFAALAGVGGGNLSTPWGTPVFGLSLALAVILIVVRLSKGVK
jgi:hypothetical protein